MYRKYAAIVTSHRNFNVAKLICGVDAGEASVMRAVNLYSVTSGTRLRSLFIYKPYRSCSGCRWSRGAAAGAYLGHQRLRYGRGGVLLAKPKS